MTFVDPHAHLRWKEYEGSGFLGLALRDCIASGVEAVGEMPNTSPTLTGATEVIEREALVGHAVIAWVNVGLTANLAQVDDAVRLTRSRPTQCRALKAYWAPTTGTLGIVDPGEQASVWGLLGKDGYDYRGIVMQHCEDSSQWRTPYDPAVPESHSWRQSTDSEILSVDAQLKHASDARFRGTFYCCHVTCPQTASLLKWADKRYGFTTVVEASWHHLFLNCEDDRSPRHRVNPPLRTRRIQELLLYSALRGDVDMIGSDHAPHPLSRKDDASEGGPACGLPALPFWPQGYRKLLEAGMGLCGAADLCRNRAVETFGLPLKKEETLTEVPRYAPELWEAYGWNPFERVDR